EDKLKVVHAELDACVWTVQSYTVEDAVTDWLAEGLPGSGRQDNRGLPGRAPRCWRRPRTRGAVPADRRPVGRGPGADLESRGPRGEDDLGVEVGPRPRRHQDQPFPADAADPAGRRQGAAGAAAPSG